MTTAGISAPLARGNRKSTRRSATAAAMLTALAGGLLLALSIAAMSRLPWAEWRLHLDARSWPQAQATIRSVSLSERVEAAAPAERPGTELVLAVTYVYEVEGVAHEGRAASFDDKGAPHDRRLKTLYTRLNFALVTGRPVTAFYDPAMPGRAVVDLGFEGRRMAAWGGLAALGAALGLWLLLSPLRRQRLTDDARGARRLPDAAMGDLP